MKIGGATTGRIQVNTIRDITALDQPAFLIQNSGNFVKDVSTDSGGVALAYFQQYILSNMDGDWVTDFQTNIDPSKYVLVIVSAYFNQELLMVSTNQSNFVKEMDASADGWAITSFQGYILTCMEKGEGDWV